MKITDISVQARNPDRVNISVDGKYRLSLDVYQVTELGIKNGMETSPEDLAKWEEESAFGKLYARALEYCLMRPHSAKEVRDYLWRKTQLRKVRYRTKDKMPKARSPKFQVPSSKKSDTYEIIEKPGVPKVIADRVYDRLIERGYIDDEKFTRYWLENRSAVKGVSRRKLISELRGKGVEQRIIDALLPYSARHDTEEIDKIIAKKRSKYPDEQKLMQYLARQGFDYDLIRAKLNEFPDLENGRD